MDKAKLNNKKKFILIGALIVVLVIIILVISINTNTASDKLVDAEKNAIAFAIYNKNESEIDSTIEALYNSDYDPAVICSAFINLGKEYFNDADYANSMKLFENSLNKEKSIFDSSSKKIEDKFTKSILKFLDKNMTKIDDSDIFCEYVIFYIQNRGEVNKKTLDRIKSEFKIAIESKKVDNINTTFKIYDLLKIKNDEEENKLILSKAKECLKVSQYEPARLLLEKYSGDQNIKKDLCEAKYGFVVDGITCENNDDRMDMLEAEKILSEDDLKDYNQSEGLRLYCRMMHTKQSLYEYGISTEHYREDAEIKKSALYVASSYRYISKSISSLPYAYVSDDTFVYKMTVNVMFTANSILEIFGGTKTYGGTETHYAFLKDPVDLEGMDIELAKKLDEATVDKIKEYAYTGKI